MNFIVFSIIIILAIIASIIEYRKGKDIKAVIVFVIGIIISILCGILFSSNSENTPTESRSIDTQSNGNPLSDTEYQQIYTEKRKDIDNALCNKEFDKVLDILKQLAEEAEHTYGKQSLEVGILYAEIGEVYNFLTDPINAKKYVDYAKNIASVYVPVTDNYLIIAEIYKSCGDTERDITEAEFYYNRALNILSDFNDTSGQLTANIYVNLSDKYSQANEHVKALESADKARKLYETYLGTTSREAGCAYCSLGNIYANRNHIKALEYYQQAEMIFKNNAPYDDSFLALCYSGLANLYSNINQAKCYEYAKAAWDLNKSIFGELHENTIMSEVAMAVYYRINNDVAQSRLFLEEALLKAEGKYGSNSTTTANIYIELGDLQDSLQESIYYYEKAEAMLKNLYGENNIHVAFVYANISISYYLDNNNTKAKEFYNKAVKIYEEKSGSFNPDLAYLYVYMGEILYYDESNYIDAAKKYNQAKQIYDKLYGTANIQSALCNYKLARLYSYTGERKLADGLFRQAIEVYELTYGEYSFKNADLYYEYANHIICFSDDLDKAIQYAEKAVELASISEQINSIDRARYCFSLGNLYAETMNMGKSIEYLKECVRITEYNNVINPTYIEALAALAQNYSLMDGAEVIAMQYVEKIVNVANEMGNSEDICAAYFHTAIALGNINEFDKALEHLDIAEKEGLKIYDYYSNNMNTLRKYRQMIKDYTP